MPLSSSINNLTLSQLAGSTLSDASQPTVANSLPDISGAVSSILKALESIQSTIVDMSMLVAESVMKGGGAPSNPRSPKQPKLSDWFAGNLGDKFSSGLSVAGSIGTSAISAVTGGLNLAGKAGKGLLAGAGGAASGAGALIGASGPLAPLTAGVTVAAGALTGLTLASMSLSRSFAEFSPQLTAVFAKSEMRGILRSQRLGAMTAGSTDALMQSIDRLKDALAPLMASMINGLNTFITPLIAGLSALTEAVSQNFDSVHKLITVVSPLLGLLIQIFPNNQPAAQAPILNDVLRQLQRGDLDKRPERRFN